MNSTAIVTYPDWTAQIKQLIGTYFLTQLAPKPAAIATQQFMGRYPIDQVATWSQQPVTDPLWQGLLTALQCGQLLQRQPRVVLGQVFGSQSLGSALQHDFAQQVQEQLLLLCLDTKNQIVRRQIVFQGTLNTCPVHPRELFQVALQTTTARIVVAHNHPSGDATPSIADRQFTDRLVSSGELLGIPVLDSLIIGENDYFSFAEKGLLNCNTD
ncbi:DNA repair protein [Lactobacillus plantarum JDM1] [Lactiplantibacillus mudanjiangensis]|uniref:JAB domain-containing protein n=1 Tax=Lactiplantibacillus mudanjiangensis TaxID=1296538 RepID=UPI001014C768|nr:JAB domain-containing protein [Lactiplantibacillus mudanjiangensis]VDG33253.1 DNA repair protein [Lactobacillus plantarum JDM1] [Lactiplantibacillus mudanjiangensis]